MPPSESSGACLLTQGCCPVRDTRTRRPSRREAILAQIKAEYLTQLRAARVKIDLGGNESLAQHSLVIHSRPTAGRLKFQFTPDADRSRAYPPHHAAAAAGALEV